jgi:hypothetical protein
MIPISRTNPAEEYRTPATAGSRCRMKVIIEPAVLPNPKTSPIYIRIVNLRNESSQRRRPAARGTFAALVAAIR